MLPEESPGTATMDGAGQVMILAERYAALVVRSYSRLQGREWPHLVLQRSDSFMYCSRQLHVPP